MTVTISPTDKRSVRALAVFATADRWTKGHTRDGRPFFAIPGSAGAIYWTDTRACTCPDRRERAVDCKHILAVRMWKLKHDVEGKPAATAQPAPLSCGDCGAALPAHVVGGSMCGSCWQAREGIKQELARAERAAHRARLRADLGLIDEAA